MNQKFNRSVSPHKGLTAYTNARLFDADSGLDEPGTLIVKDGLIADFGRKVKAPDDAEVVDCGGHLLSPGLIDIQVHFREPGGEHKETIETGSKSAVAGGVTAVVLQPNTSPTIDDVTVVAFIKERARETAYNHIRLYPSISKGLKGEQLTEMGRLMESGIVVGFTDDGLPVMNSLLMRRAMEYARELGVPVAQHAEDIILSNKGCINEGKISTQLGVRGICNATEAIIVERDILLNQLTGGHYHVLHVSTRESMEAIRRAKKMGLHVTCEVSPHHFTLTEDAVLEFNTNAKMNPPLRTEEDRLALIEGLKDGTVDAIATDHAPHDLESKDQPLATATFGIVGLETMLPLSLALYHDKTLSLREVMRRLTSGPADIIKEPAGRLKKGLRADLTLIDLDRPWTVDCQAFHSKSKNSPFQGRKLKGRAIRTVVAGNTVYTLD